MNETTHQQHSLTRQNEQTNFLVVNSLSKNTFNPNKKYMTNKKINLAKNSFLKSEFDHETHNQQQSIKSATIVNLEFQAKKSSENIKSMAKKYPDFLKSDKHTNFNTLEEASRKIVNIYRQNNRTNKNNYLLKESVDNFFKNTLKIGSCAKSLLKGREAGDRMAQTKLISVEKIVFPLKQRRNDRLRNKTSYCRINQTTRIEVSSQVQGSHHARIKSFADGDTELYLQQNTYSYRAHSYERKKKKINILEALIPIRKPSNKKDYFVFGLSDRTGTAQNKIEMYRDLLWKINYSNNLFVFTPKLIPNQAYKCYVGPGNNCNLINGIIRRRFWWIITTNKNQQGINFIWTQLKINQIFKLQESSVRQSIQKSSRKTTLRQDLPEESQLNFQTEFSCIAKLFNEYDLRNWAAHFKKNQKSERAIMENTYKRRSKLYLQKNIFKIEDSSQLRMHNHFQFNYYIGNKKALFYNIKRFYDLQSKDPFTIIPQTFHIKKGSEDLEWKKFIKYYEDMEVLKKSQGQKSSFKNVWICKPGENTNRGNGITVCYSLDDIKIRLNGRERNNDGQLRTFILQKYLQNPMLYQKRKFDIRHYALITCINGVFKFYWYEEGYIRTSSSEFNLKCSRDPLIHLTNDAVQKNTSDYGKYEQGNKLSYQDFQKYLEVTYPSKKYNLFDQILPKMRNYATEAFRACYSILDEKRLANNFQLLGLDFMIDENFQPWLIQINTNPCLELSSPLLARIIPHLIQNVMRLCLDPLFPPPEYWATTKKTFFSEDPLSENKFSLMFDETVHGKEIQEIFKDKNKIDVSMGKIEEEDETYEDEGKEDWEEKNANIS